MHGGAFQSPDTALVGDGVCIWPGWYLGLSHTYQVPGSGMSGLEGTKSSSCKVQRG